MALNKCVKQNMASKDSDETLEDRYVKLKNIAIRLKKELAEQKEAFNFIEKENKKLIRERDDQKSKYGNAQVLQAEIDKIQDLLESKSKELKLRDSEVFETAKQLSETKSKLTDAFEINDSLSVANKDFEKNNIKLEADLENLQKMQNNSDKNLFSNEDDLIKEKINMQKELSAEMDTLKQAYIQSSADLLKDDEEKQLKVVSGELQENLKIISSLKTEIYNEKENVRSLKEQAKLVDEKSSLESARTESLMATVADLRKEISKLNDKTQVLLEEKKKDRISLESTAQQLEKENLKWMEANKSLSASEESLMKTKQVADTQVTEMEELKLKHNDESANFREQMSSIKLDFDAYKARAQSVLKQKAKVLDDEYTQVVFERQQLIAQLKDAENSLQQLKCEISTCKADTVLLRSERSSLTQLHKSANEEIRTLKLVSEKEVNQLREKLKSETEAKSQITVNLSTHVEISKKLKIEMESLKAVHSAERNSLTEKIKLLENCQTDVKFPSEPTKISSLEEEETIHSDEPKLDFSSMVREDGEGSESVEPSRRYHVRLYNPPPLEHLINRPLAAESYFDDDSISVTTEMSSSEFSRLESKVSSLERSINHLSNLLSESEADNMKLNQLCEVFKENIRSSSRRELREKHLENNEYLKNVLLKFLHLKTGNEKKRLVPVLKTILQLSPDESSSLLNMAAGEEINEHSTGWSSYLHMWSNN